MLTDWEAYTQELLDDNLIESRTPQQESALIDILLSSVKQAATGQSPVGRQVSLFTQPTLN